MHSNKTLTCKYRIYYEDTDAGGVVYYANYLKFAERARTEYLRHYNISQHTLAIEQQALFVVKKADMELLKPAKLDDEIEIATNIIKTTGASITMEQHISRQNDILARINVQIVCTDLNLKPRRLPGVILEIL